MPEPTVGVDQATGHTEGDDQIRARIMVHRRAPAEVQSVNDAAVYILRLTKPSSASHAQILAELNAHLSVLRANALATLMLALPLLPEAGTVEPDVEALALSLIHI